MKNHMFFYVFQGFAFFALGPPGGWFGEALGLILVPPGLILGPSGARGRSFERSWGPPGALRGLFFTNPMLCYVRF